MAGLAVFILLAAAVLSSTGSKGLAKQMVLVSVAVAVVAVLLLLLGESHYNRCIEGRSSNPFNNIGAPPCTHSPF